MPSDRAEVDGEYKFIIRDGVKYTVGKSLEGVARMGLSRGYEEHIFPSPWPYPVVHDEEDIFSGENIYEVLSAEEMISIYDNSEISRNVIYKRIEYMAHTFSMEKNERKWFISMMAVSGLYPELEIPLEYIKNILQPDFYERYLAYLTQQYWSLDTHITEELSAQLDKNEILAKEQIVYAESIKDKYPISAKNIVIRSGAVLEYISMRRLGYAGEYPEPANTPDMPLKKIDNIFGSFIDDLPLLDFMD